MPKPIDPEAAEMLEMGPVNGRPRQDAAAPEARRRRRMGVERLALILIALTGSLSLVSYRFHLFARTYDTFIIDQVIPASGLQGWLTRTFGYDPAAYDARWRATLGSPYFPEYSSDDLWTLNATGSDYLGIWYYTREIVSGRNPYANPNPRVFVTQKIYPHTWGEIEEHDPGLPDQVSGWLGYPPMGPILILPFYLPNYFASLALYLAAVHAFLFWLGYLFVKQSPGYRLPVALLALTLFLTSFPLGFLIDRGNIEGAVVILTGLGLLAYIRGWPLISAVLFGLAASGKVIPAVFLALFLLDGRFKALLLSILVAGGATLAAMLAMHEPLGSLASQISRNLAAAKQLVISGAVPKEFDHSFFCMLRAGLSAYFPSHRALHLAGRLMPLYNLGALASTAVILLILRRAPFVNRVLVLTVMMLAFPEMSGDYKILHLYLPFGLIFLGAVRRGWASRAEVATLIMLALLFSPKSYQFGQYSVGYLINGSLLGALLVVGLRARFGEPAPEGSRPLASVA